MRVTSPSPHEKDKPRHSRLAGKAGRNVSILPVFRGRASSWRAAPSHQDCDRGRPESSRRAPAGGGALLADPLEQRLTQPRKHMSPLQTPAATPSRDTKLQVSGLPPPPTRQAQARRRERQRAEAKR